MPRLRSTLILATALGALALLLAACGSTDTSTEAAAYVFDSSVVHDLTIDFDQTEYEEMVATYAATEEKTWIAATVTIDGVTYEQVGIRLKGNSSLAGLRGDGRGGGGPSGDASADAPESLPWLIRLDKYVSGQNHQGISDLVVRSNGSETSLNEAVALELLDVAGLPTSAAAAMRVTVNGSDPDLRLVIEHLDDVWLAENIDASGVLYKAESTGDYSYRGDDPDAYNEVFDIEAGEGDLTPLIDFLQFINESDDATFAAELGDRLDVDSFATYLAVQELIDNFDDIDGPGNNSYLFFDSSTGTFTIVPWDHNLAFSQVGGPGGGPGLGGDLPGGDRPAFPGGGGQGPRGGNILSERFLANGDFNALYQAKLADLTEILYGSGAADEILAAWVGVLEGQATDVVDQTTIDSEAAAVAARFGDA